MKTQTPCCYCGFSILCFFLLLLISLSHQNLRSLLFSGNKRDRIKTLTQLAEWSLFVIDYFIL